MSAKMVNDGRGISSYGQTTEGVERRLNNYVDRLIAFKGVQYMYIYIYMIWELVKTMVVDKKT